MELKQYQKKVMHNISDYMDCLAQEKSLLDAWNRYWIKQDISVGFGGVPPYNDTIPDVPHICIKVPTGGGKTFMACTAIKRIFDKMPTNNSKVVVWLVPSDSILSQTINALSDIYHPYRQQLNNDFCGRVGVYSKDQLLNGENFSPDTVREMLTVCVMSYGSLRIDSTKKDVRKVYQENGNLLRFADYLNDKELLMADTPETALIQVLRQLSPITIVDESHNAGSDLSVEMLKNLNPLLVLDLTATPRKKSNIISYVDARELKKENMVKLPVIVYNRSSRQSVIEDAIQLRASLEMQAAEEESKGGAYIRPIVLFQAQPNRNDDSDTFEKIKNMLIDVGIPASHIAIKTSKVDDLARIDLKDRNCSTRYIITINALKEGWDCPFAYVLASLANKTSTIDVEQIVGRILRQPYAKQHSSPLLNSSYVLTCSADFHNTLENIIIGLNRAGFTRKDYRVADKTSDTEDAIGNSPAAQTTLTSEQFDTFADIQTADVKAKLSGEIPTEKDQIEGLLAEAINKTQEYESQVASSDDNVFIDGELGEMLSQYKMQTHFLSEAQNIRIPQFYLKTVPDLLGEEYSILEPENLSEGFLLRGQDSQVNFELATGDLYQVDVQTEGDSLPKYKRVSKEESEFLRGYLSKLPEDEKISYCADIIARLINRNNRFSAKDIQDYVQRVISGMSKDELAAMETASPIYARKIIQKIELLERVYRENKFRQWLDSGKISCQESYSLPLVITPANAISSIPNSLYEAESDSMNGFEKSVIDVIVGLSNVKWWHRIIDRKGFRLNGAINHYPDFLIFTTSGKIILVEAKGDYLDGDDSKTKLKLGRTWQAQSGNLYRYFMVFQNKDLREEGAYTIDEFVEVMKVL